MKWSPYSHNYSPVGGQPLKKKPWFWWWGELGHILNKALARMCCFWEHCFSEIYELFFFFLVMRYLRHELTPLVSLFKYTNILRRLKDVKSSAKDFLLSHFVFVSSVQMRKPEPWGGCTNFQRNIHFPQEIKNQNNTGLLSSTGSSKTVLKISSEDYI